MFAIAFLIGLYANCILVLGLLNLYYLPVLAGFTIVYLFITIVAWPFYDEKIDLKNIKQDILLHIHEHQLWVSIIIMSVGLMLIGILAPETAFDSLWYHLTLPKIYLAEHGIRYLSGGLLHYSTTPKLAELLYIPALAMQSEILAKLIHMGFGILTGLVVYILASKYTNKRFGLIALVIFLGNIVVLWEATTAFVDLTRAFFEIMAFWGLLEFLNTGKRKWLIESSLLIGLAIETKLIAFTTVGVYCLILLIFYKRAAIIQRMKYVVGYLLLALLIPLPWFIFAFIHTGNPLYPLFSPYLQGLETATLQFPRLLIDPFSIFMFSPDPVSPLYLIFLPLFFIIRKKLTDKEKFLFMTAAFLVIAWAITPQTGGGRFILPYLSILSIACVVILYKIQNYRRLFQSSLIVLIFISCVAIFYRGIATIQYVPVVFGLEPKEQFLTDHLNFSFGDFYDTDGEFKKLIKPSSTVLLYGFHNLYYMDVPFIDSSWVKKGDTFEYIATQHAPLPPRFKYWMPIYTNPVTGVTLYTLNQRWIY